VFRTLKSKLVAGVAAALAVGGAGGAVAATQLGSPDADGQAIVDDAAKQLGVQPSALSEALKTAFQHRVDAAVAAGKLTKVEGDALKARIQTDGLPLFFGGGPGGPRHGRGAELGAAATYLGLTEAQLRTRLESGKSLAQVAADVGKPVDGLVAALKATEEKELAAAVAAGRLTAAQEQTILAGLSARITAMVDGVRGPHGSRGREGWKH
jgi:hypothetical protein